MWISTNGHHLFSWSLHAWVVRTRCLAVSLATIVRNRPPREPFNVKSGKERRSVYVLLSLAELWHFREQEVSLLLSELAARLLPLFFPCHNVRSDGVTNLWEDTQRAQYM